MLVVDGHLHAPLPGAVVVIGRQLFQVGLERAVLDPPVEVQQARPVPVDQLARAHEPVLQILLRRRGLAEQVVVSGLGHGRPVQVAALHGLAHVAVKLATVAQEEPVLRAVRGRAQRQAAPLAGGLQLPEYVAAGTHLEGVPVGDVAAVHLEAVVVLGHGHDVACARLLKQLRPCLGIEPLRAKQRDEVLIPELAMRTVRLHVVLKTPASPECTCCADTTRFQMRARCTRPSG